MYRKLILLGLVLALCMVMVTGGAADRGNHEAIWKAEQHAVFGVESGSEWGALISSIANTMNGVSEGVHEAKDQPVPGQNK
jgi:hypothetical protein